MSETQTVSAPAWISGWTAQKPFHLDYKFVPAGTPWISGPAKGMEHRDLGVTEASHGNMSAQHIRITDAANVPTEWRAIEADFHFFYIMKGSAKLENSAGQRIAIAPGLAACQPSYLRHRIYDHSPDFEMFEMLGPAEPKIFTGKYARLPERAEAFAGLKGQYLFENADSFAQGAGPRKYFRYRDLQTSAPTDGRIHIHIVHAIEPMPGGTGWHTHSMRQLFWVIGGSAGWSAEGHPEATRVNTYDAVCVRQGQRHDVPSFTADYKVLEVCIPSEYDTVATDAPAS